MNFRTLYLFFRFYPPYLPLAEFTPLPPSSPFPFLPPVSIPLPCIFLTLLSCHQFNEVLSWFTKNMGNVQAPLNLSLWRTSGCHELLASLGFDLIGVGKDEVMLRSGKINSRRALQCTVQSLRALTGWCCGLIKKG